MITVGFLICVAAGFFLEPSAVRFVKSLAGIRFRSTPTHLVVERRGAVQCVDCVQWLADSLKTFPEFNHQPLCWHCQQQRRKALKLAEQCMCATCHDYRTEYLRRRANPVPAFRIETEGCESWAN